MPFTHGRIGLTILTILTLVYFFGNDKINLFIIVLYVLSTLFSILHIIYYIKMPKNKEHIFDRKRGAITFPGFFWEPNITMYFEKLKLFKPSGGTNAIAAPGINILSPKMLRSSFTFSLGTAISTDDMTLLTWYMDRNRPLPPLERFEPFREKDFERRKAEGFPPPLYPAFFATPEDTPEQQAERNKYWVERVGREEDGSLYTEITRGENEIFDMKTRQWVKV